MLVRVIYFYDAPDSVLIGVVPDDAFYYIQMAKHRATDGFWTFDGISPATGFHFLYGYLLFFLYFVFGEIDWRQLYLLIGGVASVFIGVASYFVSSSAEKLFGRKSILLAVAPFFTSVALMQSTAMMESWLVLFFSAATIYFLVGNTNPSVLDGIALFILGILGSLSRTDYGMLPGVIFSVYLISYPLFKSNGLKRSFIVLIGAVIGVAIVLTQNLYISGQLFQASAQVKYFWSSIIGHRISAPIVLVMSIATPFRDVYSLVSSVLGRVIIIVVLFFAFFVPVYSCMPSWRKFVQAEDPKKLLPALAIVLGCLLTVFGYILFYRHNSEELQIWYSSNFVAPIGMVLAGMWFFLFNKKILIPAIFAFCVYAFFGVSHIFSVPCPHQAGMMQAGLFLKEQNSQSIYASWNAGIISYFSGVGLIGIDGLVNDEVFPFIKSNTLFDYIKSRNINYLIDYEEMLNNRSYRVRGGYLDERMDRCLRSLGVVDGNSVNWRGSRLRVFEVIQDCN